MPTGQLPGDKKSKASSQSVVAPKSLSPVDSPKHTVSPIDQQSVAHNVSSTAITPVTGPPQPVQPLTRPLRRSSSVITIEERSSTLAKIYEKHKADTQIPDGESRMGLVLEIISIQEIIHLKMVERMQAQDMDGVLALVGIAGKMPSVDVVAEMLELPPGAVHKIYNRIVKQDIELLPAQIANAIERWKQAVLARPS